ncbi:MAG: hypothetical protein ACKORC_07295 [Acidimicrobiia bacterium]
MTTMGTPAKGARGVESAVDQRIERRIDALDRRDRGVDELARRHAAAAQRLRLRRRVARERVVDHAPRLGP